MFFRRQTKQNKPEMRAVTVRDWVDAMRDGSHQHTSGTFCEQTPNGYAHCALGVLADQLGFQNEHGVMTKNLDDGSIQMVGGTSLGETIDQSLRNLGISNTQIIRRNDHAESYEPVIDYLTCQVNVDPDAVIAEVPK